MLWLLLRLASMLLAMGAAGAVLNTVRAVGGIDHLTEALAGPLAEPVRTNFLRWRRIWSGTVTDSLDLRHLGAETAMTGNQPGHGGTQCASTSCGCLNGRLRSRATAA